MRNRKNKGISIKHIVFVGVLAIYAISAYRDATTITNEMDRCISIWTDILCFVTIIGEFVCLLVNEQFLMLLTGKRPGFLNDIQEGSSQDVAVAYNGLVGSSFVMIVIVALSIWYLHTKNRLLLNLSISIATIFAVVTAIYLLAMYLKMKNERPDIISSKFANPIFLPLIISSLLLLITRKQTIGFIYRSILQPESNVARILALIIAICYFLATAYCHFNNMYCIVGLIYVKKDINNIRRKIDLLQEKTQKREDALRKATKHVDKRAEEVGIIKKLGLFFYYNFVQIKTYIIERYYAIIYLCLLTNYRMTKWLSGLLSPTCIRINGIRFCWCAAVFELLSLDFLLFIYLESDDPCLKFFELLSTVIIIPVLLSWIAELKTKKE